jgi:hypothetical protein
MKFMQASLLEPTNDRPPPEAQIEELLAPYHPMLPLGQPSHLSLSGSSGRLSTHMVPN